ncbi:MAG: aspartate--tRNA(Asn) ligase, partial [Candidatus Aenigmarchaeota archaeon]|nr:aspartate--tRNA(Asn) ligase [Candidatus Aenigmarchaeota archaeon]
MQRSYSANVPAEDGLKVRVAGWVRELRSLSTLRFIILADREGTIQITAKDGVVPKDVFDLIPKIERESVIDVY